MHNCITSAMNINEYTPFTIASTNTEITQIVGVISKEDIEKFKKKNVKPSTKYIKIKKKAVK